MLQSILFVGIGGFFGSIFRYLIAYYIKLNWSPIFPVGTFIVNLAGSLLIGIIIAATLPEHLNQNARLLLATGFCGGFTTFSSFSFEFFSLLQHEHTGYAFLYAGSSLVFGLLFVWLGFHFGKVI
ncbi:fluoride efflux transporter CrcB [Fodinibius salsisoli]|uniref:Fluoride-specific ion channel FluC n=1 Tax=Fodinibius salsisoli TaxID=2820877 RepID=A0ABT3PMA8_9BACT|nr:fluoride efflux transporter CrcB [Fodinibius salsisoli]MCW9707091.1 fluoride efflux transporter CrcB [Fodinibius salsisoli]